MTVEGQLLEMRPSAAICLALTDAKAAPRVQLTLRSGAQFTGRIALADDGFDTSVHLRTRLGGWITLDTLEVVAVEAFPT